VNPSSFEDINHVDCHEELYLVLKVGQFSHNWKVVESFVGYFTVIYFIFFMRLFQLECRHYDQKLECASCGGEGFNLKTGGSGIVLFGTNSKSKPS